MDVVDAQIHLWQAEAPARPWPPGRAHEAQKPYPISTETLLLQMDLAGVRRATTRRGFSTFLCSSLARGARSALLGEELRRRSQGGPGVLITTSYHPP